MNELPLFGPDRPTVAPPANPGPWAEAWRRQAEGWPFFHAQQVGRRPTYLAVASRDEAMGRAFALELICGGWLWPKLRRRSHLFRVHPEGVEVFVDARAEPDAALTDYATAVVLPAARRLLKHEANSYSRAAAARLNLRWLGPSDHPALREPMGGNEALAWVAERGSHLVVAGALEQHEAEALAAELRQTNRWRPERDGATLVRFHAQGPTVMTEGEVKSASADLHRFVEGFCTWVVVSDLHLGVPKRDSFGFHKVAHFCSLLRRVIRQRSVLVLNGDFLELAQERYGVIKRAYSAIFELLARVRRIVYVAGNHDAEILQERIKETRRRVRAVAMKNTYAEVILDDHGDLRIQPSLGWTKARRQKEWRDFFAHDRVRQAVLEILQAWSGRVFLSHGFALAGVAFKRLGMRGTADEQPQWYFDETLAACVGGPDRLFKLIADRRQRLDRVVNDDWGGQVEIVRYHWAAGRRIFFEHGHAAVPSCHEKGLGHLVSLAAGWLKRVGIRHIEHWVEEDLARVWRAIRPGNQDREAHLLAERNLAVATALCSLQPGRHPPLLICGHTHETVKAKNGPVHALLHQTLGADYANSGAWSDRLRRRGLGSGISEWLEISSNNTVKPCRIDATFGSLAQPLLEFDDGILGDPARRRPCVGGAPRPKLPTPASTARFRPPLHR